MKKTLLISLFAMASGLCKAQTTISINADTITKPTYKYEADLSKNITLIFLKNPAATSIKITDGEGGAKTIKSSFSKAEQVSFTFPMASDGRTLTGSAGGIPPLPFIIKTPVIINYNGHTLTISNKTSTIAGTTSTTGLKTAAGTAAPKDDTPDKTISPMRGIEIHDAIYASNLYNAGKTTDLIALLNDIYTLSKKSGDPETYNWKNNPFINPVLNNLSTYDALIANPQGGVNLSGFISGVGNTDVTTVVDGIAKFLVKRTKQELTVNFFQHFKELLNKPKYKDISLLFPNTVQTLNSIDQDIYQYSNYINTLRSAFEQDFSLLLDNMPKVVNEGNFKDYFAKHTDVKYSALLSLFVARELINDTHPGKIIETLPQVDVDSLSQPFPGAISTIQLFSKSLRARGSKQYWTTPDTLKMLISKDDPEFIAAKFYLGFIYEKAKLISFGTANNSLAEYLKPVAASTDSIKKYIAYIQKFGQLTHNVESSVLQIKNNTTNQEPDALYHRLFDNFADVLQQVYEVRALPYINKSVSFKPVMADYIMAFRKANDLAMDIAQKNYGSSATDAFALYMQFLQIKQDQPTIINSNKLTIANRTDTLTAPATPFKALATVNSKGTTSTADFANNQVAIQDGAIQVGAFLSKYGNFMANMVKAKNSDDVEAAIDAIALPVGSASLKKHSPFSIALNAYVGPYLGAEKIKGVDDKYKANAYGITAPIGFSINFGLSPKKPGAASLSAFLSVIDLGAPVAFRFADDKTEQVPSIKLKDIVSPGAFLSFGIPKVPVSLNAGWQMGPRLRDLTDTNATTSGSTYGRWSISLVVDIPILNFYKTN
ncbi:hypothetical protein [Mucilaginibacter agri]|uniref:Uncharacterized protein n=1 Tax=Mucilaginibacter agri TaxID=2695265 RepID=A0A966DT32_9SPHI|nr:hypothetical protein [Mucilaginibacter agri]NCD70225.1 hypothetical protein [Mucilaginibacter agri]